MSRGWGCRGAGERKRTREREGEIWRDTWTDRRIDEEGDEERGMAKGRERGRGRREREGTDVYLAFPIPAQRLVSCLLSLSPFPPLALAASAGLSSLMEHIERGYESVRSNGVGAGLRGRARRGRRTNVTRSWGCWVGVDHGPPCPQRLEGRPRHHGRGKGRGGSGRARGIEGWRREG